MKQESLKFSGRASNPATKKFSPAQIAAQKLFAERARAGTLGKGKRKAVVKRKANPEPYNPYASRNMLEEYAGKTDAQLRYIIKDAGAAAVAQRGMQSEMKYLDQVNDANTVLYRRSKGLNEVTGSKIGKMKIERSETPDNPEGIVVTEAGALRFARQNMPSDLKKAGFVASVFPGARGWVINYGKAVKRNPDKAKPRAYVMRASKPKYSAAAVNKAIASSRRKISASEGKTIHRLLKGRHGNPAAAMMTGYQVICMHPKRHVVGVFKTMAEAKQIATAMANAKGVAYGVKAVKVHKTHFAV